MFKKIYRYTKGESVRCPFCKTKNVWGASWGDDGHCDHQVDRYYKEYPSIMRHEEYTKVFVFVGREK